VRQLLCPRLVARDEEFTVLADAVERARLGCGGVVLVTGVPGVGKSRLVRSVAEQAWSSGFAVLRGRSTMAVSPQPFRPLTEALVAGVRGPGLPETAELAPY
jgi:hypothetical protein